MFSLPITPTAHLGQRPFAPFNNHGSRLSHVSRAEPMGYAARHSMLESQHTLGKAGLGLPFSPNSTHGAFSRSGRHSTPVPSHTLSRTTGRPSTKISRRGSEAGHSFAADAMAEFRAEPKSYTRSRISHVTVDANSSVALSGPSSFIGNESSFRSSSSSSQESESHGSIPPQLRIISLDQDSGRIISAESPRGSAIVLSWHPTSKADSVSVTSEKSATRTSISLLAHEAGVLPVMHLL